MERPWKSHTNRKIMLCGLISGIRTNRDKKGNQIAFVQVEDFRVKPKRFSGVTLSQNMKVFCRKGDRLQFTGKSIQRKTTWRFFVDEAYSLPDTITTFAKGYKISLDTKTANKETIKNIKKIISNSKGKAGKLAFILNNKNEPKHKEFIAFDVPLDFAIETIKKLE